VWEVEYTDQFGEWWSKLAEGDQNHIDAAVEVLQRVGPALGRPLVDSITTSRHSNMKELRPIGGDKTGEWDAWYTRMVPLADELYDVHLPEIASEPGGM